MKAQHSAAVLKEAKVLKAEISKLQEIQKTHPHNSSAWQVASELLAPKFARMTVLADGKYL